MKRKIFEQQIIDLDTGEITSVTQVTVSKFNETFVMGRTTDGIEWIFELSGEEIKTLIFLLEIENLKTTMVTLGTKDRELLAESLKVGKNRVSKILKTLEDKNYLRRISRVDLVLNPKGFYKGNSKEILKRIETFNTNNVA